MRLDVRGRAITNDSPADANRVACSDRAGCDARTTCAVGAARVRRGDLRGACDLPGCSTEQASQIASNAAQAILSSATGTASDNAAGDNVTDASSESSQPEQDGQPEQDSQSPQDASSAQGSLSIEDAAQLHIDSAYVAAAQAPAYSGEPFVLLDDNEPTFTSDEATTDSFEYYGPLDSLGRCTVAYACLARRRWPPRNAATSARSTPAAGSRFV